MNKLVALCSSGLALVLILGVVWSLNGSVSNPRNCTTVNDMVYDSEGRIIQEKETVLCEEISLNANGNVRTETTPECFSLCGEVTSTVTISSTPVVPTVITPTLQPTPVVPTVITPTLQPTLEPTPTSACPSDGYAYVRFPDSPTADRWVPIVDRVTFGPLEVSWQAVPEQIEQYMEDNLNSEEGVHYIVCGEAIADVDDSLEILVDGTWQEIGTFGTTFDLIPHEGYMRVVNSAGPTNSWALGLRQK